MVRNSKTADMLKIFIKECLNSDANFHCNQSM